MGHYRLTGAARILVTGIVLLAILVTTFLPDWLVRAQAAPLPADPPASDSAAVPGVEAVPPARSTSPGLAPLDALLLSEPGRAADLEAALAQAGGTTYVHQGNALFVGLNGLSLDDLQASGARALYRDPVPAEAQAALSDADRDAIGVWNQLQNPPPAASSAGAQGLGGGTLLLLPPAPAGDQRAASAPPTSTDTSTFLAGSVTVDVVFVESSAAVGTGVENWTADEISKVKAEITSALNWWSVAATAPDPAHPENGPRPSAQITWNVKYRSPLEGTTADRAKVKVTQEPIQGSVASAMGANNWIPTLARNFTGDTTPDAVETVRDWANRTRRVDFNNPASALATDWGFVLFVVDSSADPDGRFNGDNKIAAGLLNGPWAVVTYDAGDLGVSNLQMLIAKMVGHVFGAGDETNCRSDSNSASDREYFGYLRVPHDNCEYSNSNPEPSLMLANLPAPAPPASQTRMQYAYQNYLLSGPAREQVGWRDNDGDGVYDVLDTLTDTNDTSLPNSVCSELHLSASIANDAALPNDFGGGSAAGWSAWIYDPSSQSYSGALTYHPVNINRAGYVWGRINDGDWIAAKPWDAAWDSQEEGYNLLLPGAPGELNRVEVAIVNRWGDTSYYSSAPIEVTIDNPFGLSPTPYETDADPPVVGFFKADGSAGGWLAAAAPPAYSGGATMATVKSGPTDSLTGREACFSFQGTEVSILYTTNPSYGTANVWVDGKLHSTINYAAAAHAQNSHFITNLPDGPHSVRIIATADKVIDFDAFKVSNNAIDPASVINATDTATDMKTPPGNGYYEDTGAKIKYTGDWQAVGKKGTTNKCEALAAGGVILDNSKRAGGSYDCTGKRSTRPYDRIYAFFKNADTVAIYRHVYNGGGLADVYLDGEFWGTMNNHSYLPQVTPFYISGLDPTLMHSLEIRINPVLGQTTVPAFEFDALRLLTIASSTALYKQTTPGQLLIPFNASQERYGTWTLTTTYLLSRNDGDVINLYFQGSAIAVRRNTYPTYGMMELYVDGKLVRTVDNRGAASANAAVVLHGFNPDVPHVLQVRIANPNPKAPLNSVITGYTLYKIEPVGAGSYEEYDTYVNLKPATTHFIYEEAWAAPIRYAGNPGPSRQYYIRSVAAGARAYLYVAGVDTAAIYGVIGSYGIADIYVNGELKGSFNQRGTAAWNKPYIITGLDANAPQNVIELRVSSAAGALRLISLDRVVLYNKPVLSPGVYENDGTVPAGGGLSVPALQFSGQWARTADTKASASSYDLVRSATDEVLFDIKNSESVVVYRRLLSTYGKADVYVDGKYYTSFDNYSAEPGGLYQQPYVISGLFGATHRISIRPQVVRGVYKPFDIDFIDVRGQSAAGSNHLEPGTYENDDTNALAGKAITYIGKSWITQNTPATPHDATNTQHRSLRAGDKAMVVFHGNAFTVYFNRNTVGGLADVYVDGVLKGRANTRASTTIYDVPFSVAGLENGMHTVEISVVTAYVHIDAYEVRSMIAESAPTIDLLDGGGNVSPKVLLTGYWQKSGDYLVTSELNASLWLYVTGGDTLFVTRDAKRGAGKLDIYVGGQKFMTLDNVYLTSTVTVDEEYKVGGLAGMRTGKTWIEIRNPAALRIALKMLRVNELTPKQVSGCAVEAEGSNVFRSGYWLKQPAATFAKYSGGFFMRSGNNLARMYLPVQNTSAVTINRPLGPGYGDADVYIDGKLWGKMPNYAAVTVYSAPFAIGPIPDSTSAHVIELRQTTTAVFAVDQITCQHSDPLAAGYYENDNVLLTGTTGQPGIYSGAWTKLNDVNASGGNLHRSALRGNRLSFTFVGNMVTIFRRTSTGGGIMYITIDGKEYPVNNYTPILTARQPHTILVPGSGSHTFELVTYSGVLDFDALEIGSALPATFGYYQENSPKVVVNNLPPLWKSVTTTTNSDLAQLTTNQRYASAFFLFNGQRVTAYMTQGRTWGMMTVLLDGQKMAEVDLYSYDPLKPTAPDKPFYAYDITNLPKGNHVLELRFEGRRGRGLAQANFDVISVDGAPVPRPGEQIGPSVPDTGGEEPLPNVPHEGCYEESREWVTEPEGAWLPMYSDTNEPGVPHPSNFLMMKGARASSGAPEVYAEFDFAAAGFGLLYAKDPNGGVAEVILDNEAPVQLDMYSATERYTSPEVVYSVTGLDPSVVHVVRIRNTGQAGGGIGGHNIYIDRIDLPAYDSAYNDTCSAVQ